MGLMNRFRTLTVVPVEQKSGPGGRPGATLRPDPQAVVGVRSQVKGQVAAGEGDPLALRSVYPAAVLDQELKLPENRSRRKQSDSESSRTLTVGFQSLKFPSAAFDSRRNSQ